REPVLIESWREAIAGVERAEKIVIGGKSMGGRIASMVADQAAVAGLVCLGYPFHPPGNPGRARVKHLELLRTPALIVQGERDSFGRPDEVSRYALSRAIRIEWITDGDHSFKPRVSSGPSEAQNLEAAIGLVSGFIEGLS